MLVWRRRHPAHPLAPARALAATALTTIVATLAAAAHAGVYHVYSCRTPSGQPAPVDGWSGSVTPPGTLEDYVRNTCPEGGALLAAMGDRVARTANAETVTWAFGAPPGETIAAATLWRAGDADGGSGLDAFYEFWFSGPKITNILDGCVYGPQCTARGTFTQPLAPENRVAVPAANLGSQLFMSASCGGLSEYSCPVGAGDASGYAAAVYLYGADITLEQNAGPSAGNVGGELASAPTVKGTSDVTFSASDPGSGVYEVAFSVDGQVVQVGGVNDNGGHCRDVGQSQDGRPAFLYLQPCVASVSADAGFDTTKVANGTHHLLVSVIDAAGNSAPVLDRQITIANPQGACASAAAGAAGGSGGAILSASWRGTSKPGITAAFARARTIDGRLATVAGAPIAGAAIEAAATPALAGSSAVAVAGARTGPDGRFSLRVPAGGPSRTLCLAYRGASPTGAPLATRTLALRVRAGIVLSVAPHIANAGSSIHFRGHLRGGAIPHGGKGLVLEARSPGSGWLQFRALRSDARGRFRAGYRFKFAGPARYQFRVLCEAEADYPFAAGHSNVVGVSER